MSEQIRRPDDVTYIEESLSRMREHLECYVPGSPLHRLCQNNIASYERRLELARNKHS